jgi:adenylate cyclase class 2
MRKEIEVKAKVENLQELKDKLIAMGISFSDPIIQNDETFVDGNYGDYDQFQPSKNILRIRESNGKYIFTLKQPQNNELDCIERETEIIDSKEFREALILMGYKPTIEIHKTRIKAKYKDYEICLDDVKELGSFVEVEKITDSESADEVQNELFSFLESLDVSKDSRVTHGYDTLIYIKNKIDKKV